MEPGEDGCALVAGKGDGGLVLPVQRQDRRPQLVERGRELLPRRLVDWQVPGDLGRRPTGRAAFMCRSLPARWEDPY
jgi:hypothetical protein